ncbi:MAG TPA: hypothetical protein VFJ93_03375 [Gaiellaceae bacterium]|nr:hypothetical protein [Gaiellaceae bacterium]
MIAGSDDLNGLRDAEVAFRVAPSEETKQAVIAAAVDLLVRGFEGDNLAILAGEDRSETHEFLRYLALTIEELGLDPLDDQQAALVRIHNLAEGIEREMIEPREAADAIWHAFLTSKSDLPAVTRLAFLADAFDDGYATWGPPLEAFRAGVHDYLNETRSRDTHRR